MNRTVFQTFGNPEPAGTVGGTEGVDDGALLQVSVAEKVLLTVNAQTGVKIPQKCLRRAELGVGSFRNERRHLTAVALILESESVTV